MGHVQETATSVQGNEKPAVCPVCGRRTRLSGYASYYDQSARYKTPVYYCASCDLFCRDIDARSLVSHYYTASYVQSVNEQSLFLARVEFFRWILSLLRRYLPARGADESRQPMLLDFGSSYGHLLSLAQEQHFRAVGIELNESLVGSCREKGLCVYQRLDEFSGQVDAVTSIDSLYCVPDVRELLAGIRARLKPDGIFLVRVTNRNLYARLNSRFVHKGDLSMIGDATVSYSAKSIKKLLISSGFRIAKIIPDYGKGKRLSARKRLFYLSGYLLTLLTLKRCILTPGIIVVAKLRTPEQSAQKR
jgi:2-polyprenyl-3-methyl-5-hydroxy-6-metoxy-1,4-benzoquinol methylase